MTAAAIAELKDALGPRGWLEAEDGAQYTRDMRGGYRGEALIVLRPVSTEEVAESVRICRRAGLKITPQGGNTGLVGASVPVGRWPAVVLSLSRMDKVLSVDPQGFTIAVEAGCVIERAQAAASRADRLFAMDWGARGSATVGGGVSTNAGGINVLRYGVTRNQVLGLEVVLADGRVWNGLRALRKDSSGYDLKQLFIGAEGTLGVITKAVLKLYPRPEQENSMIMAIGDFDRLMTLFSLVRSSAGEELSAFELLPGATVELALAKYPAIKRPLATRAEWYVLMRLSGRPGVADRLGEIFLRAQEAGLVTDAALAQSAAQENNLWNLRDEIPPLKLVGGKLLKWDAAVPIEKIVDFLHTVEKRARDVLPGSRTYAFGHVGDGNLHLSVSPGAAGVADEAICERLTRDIDELVWSLGGTICAEHGVGLLNRARIKGQKPAIEFEMMAGIRRLFDPDGLMNPGKIFETQAGDGVHAA